MFGPSLQGRPMSYLRYLYLFAYSGVQHISCCVFVLFFFILSMLPVSLDWPFLIAPSVFSIVYLSDDPGNLSTWLLLLSAKEYPIEEDFHIIIFLS
jgi:hypothetical protein